ncbi:hypothetical protein [Urechidicola croceus]|uniref:Uncharacterized protein n=1 Tax=Urechidicola croceus TaxID=1850246 RepID=A0A1D8P843_9FLAO|nr:hypothetical protein [Urechidicola croceus]AOW20752.1 hypothetical protein LPB138_08720 [Urechidicola croceus]
MNNADYKKEVHNLYKNNRFLEAYQCAWNLPFKDFISWFTDVPGKRKQIKGVTLFNDPFFYNSFLITQSTEWLRHKDAILLWEHYLNTQKSVIIEFELFVAHNNSSLFIEGYKNRLVFLNDKRISKLQVQHLPFQIVSELKIWNRFNNLLNPKWNKIKDLIEDMDLASYEICMVLFSAFEAYIYKNPDDKLRWYNAGESLSLLIAYIQSKYNLSNLNVDKTTLIKAYHQNVHKLKGEEVFNKVYDYVLLRENIYRYAYEPGLDVFINNDDVLRFHESDAFNEKWEYDADRYSVNEQSYYGYGEQLFDELKEENKDPNNQLGNARQLAIKQAIYDLGIRDEDLKNNKLPNLNFIISFLHGIAWRKLETSEKPLHEIARIRQNEYAKGVLELNYKYKSSEFILISNNNTLHNAAKTFGLNCSKQEFDKLIHTFSFNWKVKTFDPLKQSISLWQKPYIQIGKHIISPISILTSFTGLYTISESILKNFKPREGKRIENILKNTYENTQWKTSLLEKSQEYGDVDVVMEDAENIVFMQLKRTSQKTDMRKLYIQLPQDRRAIKQLSEAKFWNTSRKQIHLWYVTTAFEKVGICEKEVYRVSYQDLIHIKRLRDSDGLRFNSLNDFIEMIESDTLYRISKQDVIN